MARRRSRRACARCPVGRPHDPPSDGGGRERGRRWSVPMTSCPTASQSALLPFVMGYDLFPGGTLGPKRRLLGAPAEGGWRILSIMTRVRRSTRAAREATATPGGQALERGRQRRSGIGRPAACTRWTAGDRHCARIAGRNAVRSAPPTDWSSATLEGRKLAFLPRHGRGAPPPAREINYQANV